MNASGSATADRRGALYVLAAALAAHVASLRAGWVLDDWELLVENPYMRNASGLGVLLSRELGAPRLIPYYRPVTSFVYWLTYAVFGPNALLHHAFNVALHGACAVTFFLLARAFAVSTRAAIIIGVIFAVHPVSAEVVAYTGGRQDVLGWTITFATMLAIVRATALRRIAIAAFAGTLVAALTREFFLAAPAMLVVAAAASRVDPRRRAVIAAGGGGAFAIAVVLGLRLALHITPFKIGAKPFAQIVGSAAAVMLRLAKVAIAPTDIVVDVTVEPFSAGAGVALIIITGAALFAGLRAVRARAPDLVYAYASGAMAFIVLVLMHTPLAIRIGFISDRYAYGAVAATMLLASPLFEVIAKRAERVGPTIRGAAMVGIAIALVPFTWARAADYAGDDTLALAMVRERPDDPQAILAQIAALRGAGRKAEAYPLCHRYAERMPNALAPKPCLAEEAIAKNDWARAANLIEPWVYARPGDATARAIYFDALFHTGDRVRIRAALDYFEPVEPNAPDVRAAREAYDRGERGQ